jgi:hypothetical protein
MPHTLRSFFALFDGIWWGTNIIFKVRYEQHGFLISSSDNVETPLVDHIRKPHRKQYGAQFTGKCLHERLGRNWPIRIII